MSADLIARLIDAGTPSALVAEVAMLVGRSAADREAIEKRRSGDRARQSRRRHDMSRDVTLDNVTTRDVTGEPSPSPPSPFSPQTPQEPLPPHPHPEGSDAPTHEAREPAPKRRWPKAMPPPGGVTNDQWAGFVDHRKAKHQPLTPRAYELLVGKLAKLAEDGWPPGDMIDLAVERGWITVFPPKEFSNGQRSHHQRSGGNGLLSAVLDAERESRAGSGV